MSSLVKINGKLLYRVDETSSASLTKHHLCLICYVTKRTNLLKTPLHGLGYKLYPKPWTVDGQLTSFYSKSLGSFRFSRNTRVTSTSMVFCYRPGVEMAHKKTQIRGSWKVVQDIMATFMSQISLSISLYPSGFFSSYSLCFF